MVTIRLFASQKYRYLFLHLLNNAPYTEQNISSGNYYGVKIHNEEIVSFTPVHSTFMQQLWSG